jgi:hypothetical protein
MKISLHSKEIMLAAHAGVMRQVENLRRGARPKYGAGSSNDWQLHIEGCLGEYAVAKALGRFPLGFGFQAESDILGGVEVRRAQYGGRLILHPEDDDDASFVLICGENGVYEIVGWIEGRSGKRKDYWQDPAGGRPAFFVPRGALSPISVLVG